MSEKIKLSSVDKKSIVIIDKGELVSYQVENIEVMHQKGDLGWGNTEIEMFPIIGATSGNEFSIQTPKGESKQDQHGILRVMDYTLKKATENNANFYKKYVANTELPNPKFPKKSTLQKLHWPYDFEFIKIFELTNDCLKIFFEIKSERSMPFMLGFHPAFKVYNQDLIVNTINKSVSLENVLEAGASAFLLEKCKNVVIENNGDLKINLKTVGFKHMMLWSEVSNMICIEPITFYPPSVPTSKLFTGFENSNGHEKFEITISASSS